MASLEENLLAILEEKRTKVIPENIREGKTVFGVLGNLKPATDEEKVKLFKNIEEMESNITSIEGDLAVVYGEKFQNMSAETQAQTITFPETVVLPEAFSNSVYTMLRAIDENAMFNGEIQLSNTQFTFYAYTDSGEIQVRYTSEDAITYTRTTTDEVIDCGTLVACYYAEEWNDNLGYFMQVGGNYFEGMYEYKHINIYDDIMTIKLDTANYNASNQKQFHIPNYAEIPLDRTLVIIIKKFEEIEGIATAVDYTIVTASENTYDLFEDLITDGATIYYNTDNIVNANNDNPFCNVYEFVNKILQNTTTLSINQIKTHTQTTQTSWAVLEEDLNGYYWSVVLPGNIPTFCCKNGYKNTEISSTNGYGSIEIPPQNLKDTDTVKYVLVPTQLDAKASDVASNKVFYGANGVETGTLVTE